MELNPANSSRVGREASRVGVLGGTFDPVHNGHLAAAWSVLDVLSLSRVLFVPAGRPWIKEMGIKELGIKETANGEQDWAGEVTGAGHRVEMVRRAISGRSGFEMSMVDVERPGLSYSVDTIADLRREYGHATELLLILGSDALAELPRWRDPETLVNSCTLVAVGRPGGPRPEDLSAGHPGRGALFVAGPMLDISASEIRDLVRRGEPIGHLVPPAVADYIQRHGLYSAPGSPAGKT